MDWLDDLLTRLRFLDPTRREILLATGFLGFLLIIGTLGYMVIEDWPPLDSLYMTFITLTTIGFSEVHPLSEIGRIFTMAISIFGIGAVAFIATRATHLLLNNPAIELRRMQKKINQLTRHYIICGFGRIGHRIAEDLSHTRKAFVVIDNDPEKIEELRQRGYLYVEGNAEEEETLQKAGIARAHGIIVTLPMDSDNVFVTLVAREMNPSIFILARANTQKNFRKLLHAGANKVVSPYEIGADWMAQVILRPHVDQFMERVLRTHELNLLIDEVIITPDAPLVGHTLAESGLRSRYNVIVIAILSQKTGEMIFNPGAHTVIQPNDILIVLGEHEKIEQLRQECGSSLEDIAR